MSNQTMATDADCMMRWSSDPNWINLTGEALLVRTFVGPLLIAPVEDDKYPAFSGDITVGRGMSAFNDTFLETIEIQPMGHQQIADLLPVIDDVRYIVNRDLAIYLQRDDVLYPGGQIHGDNGPLGCALVRVWPSERRDPCECDA